MGNATARRQQPAAKAAETAKNGEGRQWERPAFTVIDVGSEVTAYTHQR